MTQLSSCILNSRREQRIQGIVYFEIQGAPTKYVTSIHNHIGRFICRSRIGGIINMGACIQHHISASGILLYMDILLEYQPQGMVVWLIGLWL
jgi:hypothetical protein